jgi:hypothetical protein
MDAEQKQQRGDEERARKARDVEMHKRVEREPEEIKRNPRVQSNKWEYHRTARRGGQIGGQGNRAQAPNRQMGSKEGDNLFQDKAMSKAVREKVGEYEARK